MARVKGKEQLCSCEKKHFKSIQGFGEHTLFERYTDIEIVVNKKVDEKYNHFLAQPLIEGDTMTWFSKPYNETPRRFTELQGEELTSYDIIKKNTVAHYQKIIEILKNEDHNSEAETLENSIKFINDDFVYCYDGIVVLGIWGMQLRENVRESNGIYSKNLFKEKKESPVVPPDLKEPSLPEIEKPEIPIVNPFTILFNVGENGNILGNAELQKHSGEIISEIEVPKVEPKAGYVFTGWDKNPNDYCVTDETTFTEKYNPLMPPITQLPWYKRLMNWLRNLVLGKGCLKWLLWVLLLLFLALLLIWLLRGCDGERVHPIARPIDDKPWINDDPHVGDGGGIYDPGNPYEKVPTPPDYRDVLPPNEGEMPPIDTTKIIREPGKPVIISNRLNVLMENEDKSIMDLAKEFKAKYPDDKYKVVYYDDVVKRMQIEVPPEERLKLKTEIPEKFAPEYELFVFDESVST